MVRVIVFSFIAFAVAYLLYVFPVLALLSLFNGSEIVSLWSLLPTALVFLLIRLYLATSITNRSLRAFVFYGMGVGFLSAPILSVLLLFRWLGVLNGQVPGTIAIFSIAAVTVLSIYNANSLVVRDLVFASDRIGTPRRFAFISDVHIGSNPPDHVKTICNRLQSCEFDALFIGGDLFDSSDFRLEHIYALGGLGADIYFVTGNHEGYVGGFEDLLERFVELNIRVLDDAAADLDGVNLIGVSDMQSPAAKALVVDSLYRADRFNIVLVHQPSIWLKTDSDIDLMLCGHTHNGQIWPFNLLVRLQFRHVYGLFVEGVSNLYVSSGVGCWGPRMRLGSRNEIVMIELRPV